MHRPFLRTAHATIAWRMLHTGTIGLIRAHSATWRPHIASIVRAIDRDHKTHPLRDLLIFTVWLCTSQSMYEAEVMVLLSATHASLFSDTIFAAPIDWSMIHTISTHAKRISKKKRKNDER